VKPPLLCMIGILLLNGCSGESDKKPPEPNDPTVSRLYREGPLTVVLSVSETNIPASGSVELILSVQAPEGTDVAFPETEYPDGPFLLADRYDAAAQALANGKQLHRRTWILVPVRAGSAALQPLEIRADSFVIKTEPVAVQVVSLLPPDLDALVIRDIAAPVLLLPGQQRLRQYGLIAGTTLFLLLLLFLLIHRTGRPLPVEIPAPHDAALQALAALPDDPAARVHELSRILKQYIEGRHHVPATAKTAGELVRLLNAPHFTELLPFITAAEQMRFSNRVTASFAADAERLIRSFIDNDEQEDACG